MKLGVNRKKLILFSVLLNVSIIFCQSLQIGDQQYIFVSGNWFEYNQNTIGSQLIPNKIVISCVSGNTIGQVNIEQYGLSDDNIIRGPVGDKYYVIEIPENLESFTIATSMSNNPIIDYLKFDVITTIHSNPDDPYFIDESQWNLSLIDMEKAWDINYGSENIIVAVIDYGIDLTHDELDGNIWVNTEELNGQTNVDDDGNDYVDDFYGWDFQASNGAGDNDPNPDYLGETHGTQCAGIIAAETNNNEGVASVAGGWNGDGGVKIMVLRSLDTRTAVVEAIYYATDNGADIISMSGGYELNDEFLEDAVNYATSQNHDIVFVASVGNNNGTLPIAFPAAYSNTIAVGGVIQDDTRWEHSEIVGSNYGPELDVMAPSGWRNIFCLIPWNDYSFQLYEMHGGTSAAAPHVSGLAALVRSVWPTKTWQEVRDIIRISSEKVGPEDFDENGWNQYYGYGRINAFYAISPPGRPNNFVVSGNVGEHPTSSWSPNTEPDLYGYYLYKNEGGGGWQLFRTLDKNTTSYTDYSITIGSNGKINACYRVSAFDITDQESVKSIPRCKPIGSTKKHTIEVLPESYSLNQPFPNPFNPVTKIKFGLPEKSSIHLVVYDLLGREIVNLKSGTVDPGWHSIKWGGYNNYGTKVPSGIYIYTLTAESLESDKTFVETKKMVLLK